MAPKAPARPKRYRRILTSVHHRRFVHASALLLLSCYVVSILIGVKNSLLWSWFPLGPCGFRTLFLFASCLVVIVLRVSQMHVGARTANSLFARMRQTLWSLSALNTFIVYIISAWIFGEVYVWSCSSHAELNWVKPGRPSERAQLNERPIYLHCYFFMLAIAQAWLHLYYDADRLPVPVTKLVPGKNNQKTHALIPISERLRKFMPQVLGNALTTAAGACVVGPVVYTLFLRRRAWSFTLYFAKLLWNFSRSSAVPSGYIPSLRVFMPIHAFMSGFWLVTLWQLANLLFSVFLAQPPLKKGKPLTSDVNGNASLINGLKAKREVVKAFAFWELCLIGQDYPERRKQIFTDLDGTAWKEIYNISTGVIQEVASRIEEFSKSKAPAAPKESSQKEAAVTKPSENFAAASTPEKNILLGAPKPQGKAEMFEAAFGDFAKSHGQSKDWTPMLRSKARNAFDSASGAVLSPERKRKLFAQAQDLRKLTSFSESDQRPTISPFMRKVLTSSVGRIFRQTYRDRMCKIVLGSPYAGLVPLVDATESLTRLAVASLAEDDYGVVQKDVAAIVRLFTKVINDVQHFNGVDGLTIHWTDIDFPSPDSAAYKNARTVRDIDIFVMALKKGLTDLLGAFKQHLTNVGLTSKDIRLAQEAAGLPLI